MWIVKRIDEDDFGCEERMPGEPLTVIVTLEAEDGRIVKFSMADDWLRMQEIDEGDEWPEDIDSLDNEAISIDKMESFMENYFRAIEELEEEF